jgi:hypothetical protein
MAKLIYAAICSLDGYVADTAGNFDWSAPDEEVHKFVNDLERAVSGAGVCQDLAGSRQDRLPPPPRECVGQQDQD